mmetsp:Transcript_2192/g.2128  ORF Transcript_2192/g.2128 Transcript_2192/m.2128 type:complete len:85 (-) Transcript_2192:42-296(-)
MKLERKQLRKQIKGIVNKIGPELFKNFDKLKFIMKQGSNFAKTASRGSTPQIRTPGEKSDIEISYLDELEINEAFACLKELENI